VSSAALRLGVAAFATAAAAVALGGCGGSGRDGSPEASRFVSVGCASCHTLNAADAHGRVGPNLDSLKPDAATVERQMRNGGGGMPSFEDKLSASELRSLARWVASNAGK
jgi:mono/diheme cytochrome c family protein